MSSVIVEKDVDAKMRDGTILRCDVYRPSHSGQFPVLLQRIPYSKSFPWLSILLLNPLNAADQGYVVVIQDCRGRFTSDGDWGPFHVEGEDGYDSVEWCARQPWSNGKVGIYGSSYMGVTTWQAVINNPPHLEAAFVRLTGTNYHDGWAYSGGAFELGFNLQWALSLGWDKLTKLPSETRRTIRQSMFEIESDNWAAYQRLPLNDMHAYKEVAPYYFDWLAHPSYDEYWRAVNVGERYDKITVPVLQMTGWFDNFLIGHLRSFDGITKKGATDKARRNQKIIIGPWPHNNYMTINQSKVGDFELGHAAIPNAEALAFRWFDHWLKGVNTGIMNESPVRIFVMGANAWRDEEDWPLKRAKKIPWYLHSGGHANTLNGDGVLTTVSPKSESPDSYTYDPADPVPTIGGRILMPEVAQDGFRDQRSAEERSDVLVYTSPLLMKDIEVTGPLALKLWAATSAKDTDFTAKLVDVYPDGYAAIVADGILRARYRESMAEPKLLEPGQIYELAIDLWATSQVFKKGHHIRIEVSSSNFPRFDRNLNTGGDNASAAQVQIAFQTIYHDAERPSHIVLYVVE
ncbi:CocE/NonD family hydrolase [Chloroflexota bacterium]